MLTWPITRIIISTVAAAAAGLTLASSPAVAEPVEEGRLTWASCRSLVTADITAPGSISRSTQVSSSSSRSP